MLRAERAPVANAGNSAPRDQGEGIVVETAEQRSARHRSLFETITGGRKDTLFADDLARLLVQRYEDFENMDEVVCELMQSIGAPSVDAGVDFATFSGYLSNIETALRSSFASLDKNRDGRVDIDEFRVGLQALDLGIKEHQIKLLFNTLDLDSDGFISAQDWLGGIPFIPNFGASRSPLEAAYLFFIEDMDVTPEGDIKETLHGMGYFAAGGLAGVVSRTATAPFDRLKVFLIAQSGAPSSAASGAGAASAETNTIAGALRYLWKQGGIRSFFVGNGLNVIKVVPESAMKFGSFEAAKRFFCTLEGVNDPSELSRTSTFFAGGIGGMISQFTIYPIDTLKFRIQCGAPASGPKGAHVVMNTIAQMWADGGPRLFYRGIFVGVTGIFPFAALDLGTFSAMKRALLNSKAHTLGVDPSEVELGNMTVLSMGALSGSVGAAAVYPINLLRTRLQAQGTAAHPYRYTGFKDVFVKTVNRDGVRGLYRGLGPNLAKVAPAVSISYLVYENTKRLLNLE